MGLDVPFCGKPTTPRDVNRLRPRRHPDTARVPSVDRRRTYTPGQRSGSRGDPAPPPPAGVDPAGTWAPPSPPDEQPQGEQPQASTAGTPTPPAGASKQGEPQGEEHMDLLPNGIQVKRSEALRVMVLQYQWDNMPAWEKLGKSSPLQLLADQYAELEQLRQPRRSTAKTSRPRSQPPKTTRWGVGGEGVRTSGGKRRQ